MTIVHLSEPSATCKYCLQVRRVDRGLLENVATVKYYLRVQQVDQGKMEDMAVVKCFFTTQACGRRWRI